jgi:hypothetical protein
VCQKELKKKLSFPHIHSRLYTNTKFYKNYLLNRKPRVEKKRKLFLVLFPFVPNFLASPHRSRSAFGKLIIFFLILKFQKIMSNKHTYKSAGVDVDAGNRFVKSIGELVARTHRPEVVTSIGGFGGLFQPDFSSMKQPVLVSSVDGVGTKLIIAFKTGVYHTVGQCLVNHCVNDIAVCGAEPLFFLDYFSTGKAEQEVAYDVLKGFSIACEENGCALIGGETAEMPDIYARANLTWPERW